MAQKQKTGLPEALKILSAWQRFRDVQDAGMADALTVSTTTWRRYRSGVSDIPHAVLLAAVNFLRVPEDDAIFILTAGLRRC